MRHVVCRTSLQLLWVTALLTGGAPFVIWTTRTSAELPMVKMPAEQSSRPASDWRMYRHDEALTAASPIRGGLGESPQVVWSIDLGGPQIPAESIIVRDVTGDGRDEFLAIGNDTVTCRDSRGQMLWKLDNMLNPSVVDVRDFAGDGSRGIFLTTARGGKVDAYMVSGRTGRATHLWLDENNFGGHTRIGRLLPDVAGAQIAATASGQTPPAPQGADIRLVSFERGLADPRFHVRRHVEGAIYSPIFLFADLDADGSREMVVISHEQIWAFDPRTGQQTFSAAYGPQIRTYSATVAAVKLQPQDRHPALVMINPHLPGLKAVEQDGKTFARELWKVVIGGGEDQYQRRVTIGPAGPALVVDLQNNGSYVILASIQNEHGDGQERLVMFDARSGERLAESAGAKVLAVDDLDGDGKPEILLRRGSDLHISQWRSGELKSIWQGADVLPVVRGLPSEGDLGLTSANIAATNGNVPVWREQEGSSRFLLRFADGVFSCGLGPNGLDKGQNVTVHDAFNNLSKPDSKERVVWDGARLITFAEDREVYRYEPPTPTTYLAPPPLVADLAGERRILIRDSAGDYQICSAAGAKERTFLAGSYETPQVLVDAAGIGPAVCDMDGDGENDVVATITNSEGLPTCVILDAQGKEKLRLNLLPGMTAMNRGSTGRLGPKQGMWILLRMSGEGSDHERRNVLAAFDGRTGKLLWERHHYGHYGSTPVICVPHFPSPVLDYDNDGADDWIICSENFYGIIGVKDNKDLVGPVVLSDALPGHWTAYTFPSLATLPGDDKPTVFHHGAYSLVLATDLSGRPLWHFGMTRDTAGRWGQVVDLNGDNHPEILHAQPDGMVRCFTPSSCARCPICLPDKSSAEEKSSVQRWQLDMSRPVSRMISADLDCDGSLEVLFGGDDGKLHALGERGGKPTLLWSVPLGRRVGEPVLTDLDVDGQPEILVTVENGKLCCLKDKR
jgi:hypothetical protein